MRRNDVRRRAMTTAGLAGLLVLPASVVTSGLPAVAISFFVALAVAGPTSPRQQARDAAIEG